MSRFYVTTPIYYVNDVPHIGHAYTTIVADALARWHRLRGDQTYFLTGTDEHGLKIQRAAVAAGETPRELADRVSERFREAWRELNISNDDFIRTTEERHYAAVQHFLEALHEAGAIELGSYSGLYCVPCEAYYQPDDLVDGCCPIHTGRPVEEMAEENYFFKLSAYQDALLDYYERHPDAVVPESRRNEVLGFIRQGLQDFSISRTSVSWGVPLPWDPSHVAYVWGDALINYATAVGYGTDDARFNTWWPAATHLIGKDILRFHAVFWPAMLLAAGLEPPRQVVAHGWLLVGGEKMSKTKLNQIFPSDLVADFGVDGVRYHFLRDTTFGTDGDFSYEAMVVRYNSDLANNLGNLVSRVTKVVGSKCGGQAPVPRADSPLRAVAESAVSRADAAWLRYAPHEALDATWSLIRETNAFLEAAEPWKTEPGPATDDVMGDALEALRIVTILASVAVPRSAELIWERLGQAGSPSSRPLAEAIAWGAGTPLATVGVGEPLFPRRKA